MNVRSRVTIRLKPFDGMMMKNIWLAKRGMNKKPAATELGSWFWIHQTKITSPSTKERAFAWAEKLELCEHEIFISFKRTENRIQLNEWATYLRNANIYTCITAAVYMLWDTENGEKAWKSVHRVCVVLTCSQCAYSENRRNSQKNTLTTKNGVFVHGWSECVERTHTRARACYSGRLCKNTHTMSLSVNILIQLHMCVLHTKHQQ